MRFALSGVLIQLSKSDSSTLVKRAGHSYVVVRLPGCNSHDKGLLVWTFSEDPKWPKWARTMAFLDMAEWRG